MNNRTAVCLYGFMRTYKQTANSLIKNVIKPNNADLFIYTSDNEGVSNIPMNTNINAYKCSNGNIQDLLGHEVTYEELNKYYGKYIKNYSISKYNIEKFKKESKGIFSPILPIERFFSLYWNITNVVKLVLEYEEKNNFKYDNIIIARPDLQFYSKIDIKSYDINYLNIAKYGGNINPCGENELYYCGYYKNVERCEYIPFRKVPFSDQLIISDRNNLTKLSTLYDNLKLYDSYGLPICHPETTIYYHIGLTQDKKVKLNDIKYEILRNSYIPQDNEFLKLFMQKNTNNKISKKEKYKQKYKDNINNLKIIPKSLIGLPINYIKYLIYKGDK